MRRDGGKGRGSASNCCSLLHTGHRSEISLSLSVVQIKTRIVLLFQVQLVYGKHSIY